MKAYIRFYTIDQNSQHLYSAEASDMLQATVYFRVAKETGEKNKKGVPIMEPLVEPIMAVEISQPGGTSYTQDRLEVSQPYVLPDGIKANGRNTKAHGTTMVFRKPLSASCGKPCRHCTA